MKKFVYLILIILSIIIGLLVVANNSDIVKVNFIFGEINTYVSYVIAICFFTGFTIAWTIFLFFYLANKLRIRSLKKQINSLLKDKEQLK